MRSFSFVLLLLLSTITLVAQTPTDSVLIAEKKWNKQKISKGLVWKQAHFDNLYESKQEINILELNPKTNTLQLELYGLARGLMKTSQQAKQENAIAAINGSFFDMKNGGSITYLKRNDSVINVTTMNAKGQINEGANGAFIFGSKTIDIVAAENNNLKWEEQIEAPNIMVCGPVLLMNDTLVTLSKSPFNLNRHPRSAVALTKDNKVLFITVDGRNKMAQGMNLNELAYLLKILGATKVLNLDGGGSTALFVDTKGKTGILNYPSDNKRFDHEGERAVANTILIKKH